MGVHIKPLIGHGELGGREIDSVFLDLWWPCGFRRWSGLLIPKSQVLEDLFDDVLILYHTDNFHLSGAFRTR